MLDVKTISTGKLQTHPLYASITDIEKLRLFMERHVFAVLDFMSLAKRLQAELAPTKHIWTPPKNPELARFINEIILAEESDTDLNHSHKSHYEIYLQSMKEVGASTELIEDFAHKLSMGLCPQELLSRPAIPKSVQKFSSYTYNLATNGSIQEVAAAFCHGRERIIPEMFQALIKDMNISQQEAPSLYFYLQRHIEIDGDEHGPLAERMISYLCNTDEHQKVAQLTAVKAMDIRLDFWADILLEL